MVDDSGQLSIDFIAGFTIFMIALIMVITMTSGLLVGLHSQTVDVDAVAYRTGVILMEDPGECNNYAGVVQIAPDRFSWETVPEFYRNYNVFRMGLGIPRYYYDSPPNVLMVNKTNKFFCQTYWDEPYYRSKLILGDFPYRLNLSIMYENETHTMIGNPLPENGYYGSIRRIGLVKDPASTDVSLSSNISPNLENDDRVIVFPFNELYNASPAYQVYPLLETSTVNFVDFPSNITNETEYTSISKIRVCYPSCDDISPGVADVIVDGIHHDPGIEPVNISLNRTGGTNVLVLAPALFQSVPNIGPLSVVNISITFSPYTSNTTLYLRGVSYYGGRDFSGNYTWMQKISPNGTTELVFPFHQPNLTPVWVEARIW